MKLSEAQRLAVSLMREHGLAQMGWTFGWDRARRRLGACHHDKRLISLLVPLTIHDTDDARVRNTILHEIAHALVGAEHGHDYVWRCKAREDRLQCRELRQWWHQASVSLHRSVPDLWL